MAFQRIAVVASASGSGKTTLGRALAAQLGARFIELDALRHGPDWTDATPEELCAKVAPLVAEERWVLDGTGTAATPLGRMVLERAQLVVWLDLPPWVWLPRLLRRSWRRWVTREALWNGNRETLYGVFLEKEGLLPHAIRKYFWHRGEMAARVHSLSMAGHRIVRLCSVAEVAAFVTAFATRQAI
jgi:shikimate kinase